MQRLIIVSNRLPVNIVRRKGTLHIQSSVGGLATGMKSFYKKFDSLWIGWPGIIPNDLKEKKYLTEKLLSEFQCFPVF